MDCFDIDVLSYDDENRCCSPPGGGHCEVTTKGDVKCSNSTLYHGINQPCNGKCNGEDYGGYTVCPDKKIREGAGHQECYL